jgi:protein BCP1
MAKQTNQKRKNSNKDEKQVDEQKQLKEQVVADEASSDDEISSEEEGEDLILEGVLVRNPDVDSSDGSSDSSSDSDEEEEEPSQPPSKKQKNIANQSKLQAATSKKNAKHNNNNKNNNKKKKAKPEAEIIPVVFTFNDMNDKYFHGIKNHLLTQPVYAGHSSAMTDIMIENVSVGTVVSTDDGEDNIFGFASVLNITTFQERDCIKKLKQMWLNACPTEHKHTLTTVLSGTTKRPAGIFLHGRMVNLPLEITHVLHEQLVKDMDWAVENAEGGEEERKSLNFGAFLLLAPCTRDNNTHSIMYKNFDDEIFAGCAEFVFTITSAELRKGAGGGARSVDGENEDDLVNVIVMTKTGHRQAMVELKQMIHG